MSVMYRILTRQSVLNYEGLVRQYLRESLHVRDRDISQIQDNTLKECAVFGERVGLSPIECSMNYAISLYEQWALSEDEQDQSHGASLYVALVLAIPLAGMMGDVRAGMEAAILDGLSAVVRSKLLKYGIAG